MSYRESDCLASGGADRVASLARAVLGAVPTIGPALAEIFCSIIPNQRMERVTDFLKKLGERVNDHQKVLVEKRLIEPEGVDILEEALWQSARALSEDRRQQIATLVMGGLSREEVDLARTKMLLLLLAQVSDVELVLMHWYADRFPKDAEFEERF